MDGAVPREVVVAVLRANGVNIAERTEEGRTRTTMIKDSVAEVQFFPDLVPRRLVLRLAHKFEVPSHYFWHPEMMPEEKRLPGLLPS